MNFLLFDLIYFRQQLLSTVYLYDEHYYPHIFTHTHTLTIEQVT